MTIKNNKCPNCKRVFIAGGVNKNGYYYECIHCGIIFDIVDDKLIERKKEI